MMSIIADLLGTTSRESKGGSQSDSSYSSEQEPALPEIHLATVREQEDIVAVKETVREGDIVILYVPPTVDMELSQITAELKEFVETVDGDIVHKRSEEMVVTPSDVSISRSKLEDSFWG